MFIYYTSYFHDTTASVLNESRFYIYQINGVFLRIYQIF